jgi:hypothetical protein
MSRIRTLPENVANKIAARNGVSGVGALAPTPENARTSSAPNQVGRRSFAIQERAAVSKSQPPEEFLL